MAPDLLPVLGNRSACYLQLGELVRCIEDCDQLMQRLDEESMHANANPNDPVKLAMRLKALARRGTALCQQGNYGDAVGDYRLAVTLTDLGDASLVADLRRVMGLAKCSELKKKADGEFGAGQLEVALETYGEALKVEPGFVSAISNRAACLLALGRLEECVDDCSAACTRTIAETAACSPVLSRCAQSMCCSPGKAADDWRRCESISVRCACRR